MKKDKFLVIFLIFQFFSFCPIGWSEDVAQTTSNVQSNIVNQAGDASSSTQGSEATTQEKIFDSLAQVKQWSTVDEKEISDFLGLIKDETQVEAIELLRERQRKAKDYETPELFIKEGALLDGALKKDPENPVLIYAVGNLFMIGEQYEIALATFLQLSEKFPGFPYLNRSIGRCYMGMGDKLKAIAFYEEATKDINSYGPNEAWKVYNNLGILYNDIKDYKKSVENYLKAMELNPDEPFIYQNIGLVYQDLNELDKAIENGLKAINIRSYPAAHYSLGQAYRKNKDYEKSIAQYKKAVELAPNFIDAWHGLAMCYYDANDLSEAEETYLKILSLDYSYAPAMTNLSVIYNQQGQFQKAIDMAQKTLRYDPENQYAKKQLQFAYSKKDESKQNIDNFLVANSDAKTISKEAEEYFEHGKFAKAIPKYEEALKLNPYDEVVLMKLGQSYFALKDYQRAEEYLQQAYKLNPYNEEVARSLAFVFHNVKRTDEFHKLIREFTMRVPETKTFDELLKMGQ